MSIVTVDMLSHYLDWDDKSSGLLIFVLSLATFSLWFILIIFIDSNSYRGTWQFFAASSELHRKACNVQWLLKNLLQACNTTTPYPSYNHYYYFILPALLDNLLDVFIRIPSYMIAIIFCLSQYYSARLEWTVEYLLLPHVLQVFTSWLS